MEYYWIFPKDLGFMYNHGSVKKTPFLKIPLKTGSAVLFMQILVAKNNSTSNLLMGPFWENLQN